MNHECHEGFEAKERFEKLMAALFRAPKPTVKPSEKPADKTKVHESLLGIRIPSTLRITMYQGTI